MMTELVGEQISNGPAVVVEPPRDDSRAPADAETKLVEKELLVEDVSIDGMCGVY